MTLQVRCGVRGGSFWSSVDTVPISPSSWAAAVEGIAGTWIYLRELEEMGVQGGSCACSVTVSIRVV